MIANRLDRDGAQQRVFGFVDFTHSIFADWPHNPEPLQNDLARVKAILSSVELVVGLRIRLQKRGHDTC